MYMYVTVWITNWPSRPHGDHAPYTPTIAGHEPIRPGLGRLSASELAMTFAARGIKNILYFVKGV